MLLQGLVATCAERAESSEPKGRDEIQNGDTESPVPQLPGQTDVVPGQGQGRSEYVKEEGTIVGLLMRGGGRIADRTL